jgi:hypothetical protein
LNATSTNNSHYYIFKHLGIKPLKLIILCEDSSVRLSAARIVTFFGVDAVKLWRLITAANEDTEVYVGRA